MGEVSDYFAFPYQPIIPSVLQSHYSVITDGYNMDDNGKSNKVIAFNPPHSKDYINPA